jgi:nitrite reductase/ring-hydroxylating ferredoxin subunit
MPSHQADLNGVKLLIVRDSGELRCLADVCSHLGGPLAEGTIEAGAVTCPWHASRFSLSDGSVLDGPATHPQPCFDVRESGGQIQIKSRQKSEPRA